MMAGVNTQLSACLLFGFVCSLFSYCFFLFCFIFEFFFVLFFVLFIVLEDTF